MTVFERLGLYLSYPFVRYALLVGVLIALCSSLFGTTLVLKRLSFMGDGLSHVAFGAMAVAMVLGVSAPMWIVLPITAVCAVLLLGVGKRSPTRGDATVAMLSVGALALGYLLLHFFPFYRIAEISLNDYYTEDQMKMALYIGSASDREEVISVLLLANKAFNDVRHTRAENEEEYGLLARYATPTDSYEDAAFNEHSLDLWSAHLDENEGWIWVYYSSETFDHNGKSICGSWRIPSLWQVEKNENGEWVVVQIREHP
jgi:hypothetical protein